MQLLLVNDDQGPVSLAVLCGGEMYCYVPNTGKFHRNQGLRYDYYSAYVLTHVPIGLSDARRHLADRIGHLDCPEMAWFLDAYRADTDPLDVDAVFAMTLVQCT